MDKLRQSNTLRAARLDDERRIRAQREAHSLAKKDIEMGTVGKGSNHDKLLSENLAFHAAGQIPIPPQYAKLEQKKNRCSTCNQPGHNTACCKNMTVFSVVQQYIRKRGSKMFQDAIVLTKDIQAELSHEIFNEPREVADVDADRDSPIYPDGYEAGTFNGPVEADIDLTVDDPESVPPPAKKPKSYNSSSRGQQMEDDSDNSDDSDSDPANAKGKGKAKGNAEGNANSKPYSRRAALKARESSGDDEDNESSDDEELLAAAHAAIRSRNAGTSTDVMDLCSCSDDSSSKK